MERNELLSLLRQYTNELNEDPDDYEPIPKKELIPGEAYSGICRNAREAKWNGEIFTYARDKFGDIYDEEINHYEDDNGFDIFVPIRHKHSL